MGFGAAAQCIDVTTAASGVLITVGTNGRVNYRGFSLRESAGATALIRVREATSTGKILDTIPLAANEGASDWYETGKICNGSLYFEVSTGDVEGSIFHS